MAKTTKLGLNLETDGNTSFDDWRQSIDGYHESGENISNMEILDRVILTRDEITSLVNDIINGALERSY